MHLPADLAQARGQHGHWSAASRLWNLSGPPLRPCAQDVAFAEEAVHDWSARARRAPRALLLGVTPELCRMAWPAGTDLLAIDRSQEMIDAVWPDGFGTVRRADWLAPGLAQASRDVVLCDGGLHLLAHPDEQQHLARTLHALLAPGGACIFRLFVPPARRELPETVLDDLLGRRVPNLNVLKLRLGMALMQNVRDGVRLADVWRTLNAVEPDWSRLATRIGWSEEHLAAIDTYRDSPGRYHFATLDEAAAVFCSSGAFRVADVRVPSHELGERCPTVTFARCDP